MHAWCVVVALGFMSYLLMGEGGVDVGSRQCKCAGMHGCMVACFGNAIVQACMDACSEFCFTT